MGPLRHGDTIVSRHRAIINAAYKMLQHSHGSYEDLRHGSYEDLRRLHPQFFVKFR